MRIVPALLLFAIPGVALAQSAPLTAAHFIERYNMRLARDGQDPVADCKPGTAHRLDCRFDDTEFRTTLDGNGDITGSIGEDRDSPPTAMVITLAGDGIDSIALSGDRARPADLINFTAHLESLLHTLGPGQSDYAIEADTLQLGVMRGDKDEDIGQARSISESFATVSCLNQRFTVSVGIACVLKPGASR